MRIISWNTNGLRATVKQGNFFPLFKYGDIICLQETKCEPNQLDEETRNPKGYYSYFIGEPAWNKDDQLKLGFIKEGEPPLPVFGKTGYVILPDGTIKWLSPTLLRQLISDNEELLKKVRDEYPMKEDIPQMFRYLHTYNLTKK